MGRPPQLPWHSASTAAAGLPRERAAWLAAVLPVMDASPSHPACAAALTAQGHPATRIAVAGWYAALARMLAAGELPERTQPLPVRRPGWHEGAPTPSAEASRAGAAATNTLRAARRAAPPPPPTKRAPRKRPKRRRTP
jgi:hypothetical protein